MAERGLPTSLCVLDPAADGTPRARWRAAVQAVLVADSDRLRCDKGEFEIDGLIGDGALFANETEI